MKQLPLDIENNESSAVFSPDGIYRYELWRRWGTGKTCVFIGLNPSTADETKNDPTIRRCIDFAKRWGCSQLCMLNLFAYRATKPQVMKSKLEPIGDRSNLTIRRVIHEAAILVVAWGHHGTHLNRARTVMNLIEDEGKKPLCFGFNADGTPTHPLYQPTTATLIPYELP